MFQLLPHDSSHHSNYLIMMTHAKLMAPGLDLVRTHLFFIKATASIFHIMKHWIYQLQNWLLASLVIKLFNALSQILLFLNPNASTFCLLPYASSYAFIIIWDTKASPGYRSGPLKVLMEFQVMLQLVWSLCVMCANMTLQRNARTKCQTLALWLALHWVQVISCWWIRWLRVAQD